MKKNIILLIIFSSLCLIAYYFEEFKNNEKVLKTAEETQLFYDKSLGDLKELHLYKTILLSRDGKYFLKKDNRLASMNKVEKVFSILSALKIRRIFSKKEQLLLDEAKIFRNDKSRVKFVFEKGEIEAILGVKIDYGTDFYMKINSVKGEQWVLVYDSTPYQGLYDPKAEKKNSKKYRRLLSIFYLDDVYFYDLSIFKDKTILKDIRMIEILGKDKKPFKIQLKKKITNPSPQKNIKYNAKSFNVFYEHLVSLRGEKVFFNADKEKLDHLLSTIKIDSLIDIKLYESYQKQKGYFVYKGDDNIVFKVKKEDALIFFLNIQDFWNKKVLDLESLKQFELCFIEECLSFSRLKNGEYLVNKKDEINFEIDRKNLKSLLNLLSSEALEVRSFNGEKTGETLFEIRSEDGDKKIVLNSDYLLLIDEKKKLLWRYQVENKDFLKLKKHTPK